MLNGSVLPSSGSVLELPGIVSVQHEGSFLYLLKKATRVTSPLRKPHHVNQINTLFLSLLLMSSGNSWLLLFLQQFMYLYYGG